MFVIVTVDKKALEYHKFSPLNLKSAKFTCRSEEFAGINLAYVTLSNSNRVNWKRLSKIINSRPVLISNKLNPPAHWSEKFPRCYSKHFPDLLAMRVAIKTLEESDQPFANLSLGVIDESAAHLSLAELAVLHFTHIRLYTKNERLGNGFANSMMASYGAPVILTDSLESLSSCTLLISFDELLPLELARRLPPVVYSPFLGKSDDPRAIQGIEPTVPENLLKFLPHDIDPLAFMSAIYDRQNISKACLIPTRSKIDAKLYKMK